MANLDFAGSMYATDAEDDNNVAFVKKFVGDEAEERIAYALDVLFTYSQIDGEHHKVWSLDQIARVLTGENYEAFIKIYESEDEDGEPEYIWDAGTAP